MSAQDRTAANVSVKRGDRLCRRCRRVHDAYPKGTAGGISWADPTDGHAYYPEAWEDVAKRYGYSPQRERELSEAAEAGALAVQEHAHDLRRLADA